MFMLPITLTLLMLVSFGLGLYLVLRPSRMISLQQKFYEKINWKMTPLNMKREILNTRLMGIFLLVFALLTAIYIVKVFNFLAIREPVGSALLWEFVALAAYVSYMGYSFCDGFKLSIERKVLWVGVFLMVSLFVLRMSGEYNLAMILPIPSIVAIALGWSQKMKTKK